MNGNVGSGAHAVGEEDLQAYVDGLLDGRRRSEVEAYLAAHPDEVERVEAYRLQNIGLHALFDRSLAESGPAPIDRLRRNLHALVTRQRLVRRAAACFVLVLGIGAGGWWGSGFDGPPRDSGMTIARQTGDLSHRELRDPPRGEVAPVSLIGWLSQRTSGQRPAWPDLRPFGLALRAERMAAAPGELAVVLVYEDAVGRELALHIDLNGDDLPIVAPAPVREEEVALYWRSGPVVLGVVGAMERKEVLRIAEAVTDQVLAAEPARGGPGDDQLVAAKSEPAVEAITETADGQGHEVAVGTAPEDEPEAQEAVKPPDDSPAAEPAPAESEQGAQPESDTKPVSTLAPRLRLASHQDATSLSPVPGGGAAA